MEFRILGPLEVVRQGQVLPPPANKPRALLALLLLHRGEVVTLERLADDLWGERPPATAAKSIQVYVSQLRKTLGLGVLETRGRGYALAIEPEQIDAFRFERMVEQGVEHLAAGRPREGGAILSAALALWRGPALADFAYEPWARAEIARLEDLRLAALEERVDADLALGRHGTVIAELEGVIARHPTRERLLGQLMLALYRSGRQTEALEVYRERRQRMVDELGIEPAPALRELEAAILRQDPELRAPARLSASLASTRRRGGGLIALGGGALLLAGIAAAVVAVGREADTPVGGALTPLPAHMCSPVAYHPGAEPRHLIASDQELEGPLGVLGNQIASAVEFVLRENRFTAGGRAVAYQACDSTSTGECVEGGKVYAANAAVLGVVGPMFSICAADIIPVANRAGLAVVSPSTTRVGLTRSGTAAEPHEPERYYPTRVRNFVRVVAADDFQFAANAMLAQRLGVRRAFVLHDGDEGVASASYFRSAAENLGLRVVGSADWLEAGRYRALARRIHRRGADGVVFAGALANGGAGLVRAVRSVLGPDVHLLAGDGFSVPDLVAQVGPASEGMTISVPGVDPRALTGPARRLIDRMRRAIGEPHPYAVSAAQATQLLLDAIGRSDGTRRSVVSELFASEVTGGLLGDFSVTPTGDTTANRVTIYRIERGERRVHRVLTPPLSLVVSR